LFLSISFAFAEQKGGPEGEPGSACEALPFGREWTSLSFFAVA